MSLPSRRAGLSYGDKPKPLLSMVGGKSTKADDKASNNSKSSSTESENASPGTKASTGGAGAKTGLGVNKPMFKMPASLSGDDSDDEKSNVNGKPGKNKAVSLAGLGRKSPSKNADVKTGPPKFKVPDSLSSDDVDSDGNNKPIPNKAPPTGLARKISGPCGASADMIARKATFNLNMPRSCSSDDLASDKLAKGDKALEDKTSSAGATSQPGRKTSLSRFNVPGTSSPDEIAGGSPDEPSTKPTSQAASAPVSYPNPRRMKKITFSSDEESDRGTRANSNLRKTTFGASKTGKHANSLGRDDPEDEGPLKRRKVETKSATLPGSSQNKSSQESARAPTSSGEHMLDSLGFARKNKVKATFGSKGAPIRSEPRQERTGLAGTVPHFPHILLFTQC